jgi:hypothetical protein
MPNMTVFDNVSVGAIGKQGHSLKNTILSLGQSKADKSISEMTWSILERVQLTDKAAELAANLSYGRRKVLEIGRALATEPKLLDPGRTRRRAQPPGDQGIGRVHSQAARGRAAHHPGGARHVTGDEHLPAGAGIGQRPKNRR